MNQGSAGASDPTRRFADRVENYIRYRPHYPAGLVEFLQERVGLRPAWVVADVGSGTGISTEPLLKNGNIVCAVEPNRPMREAAERLLGACQNFRSVEGRSEATGLADESVDLIVAMQAFHWFEPAATGREFRRILKRGGWVVLVWNERKMDTPFLHEYEELIKRFATDYARVRHENVTRKELAAFFGDGGYQTHVMANEQRFDFEGLKGRLLSSSYVPGEAEARGREMVEELRDLFEKHQAEGRVVIGYDTRVHFGRLGS